MLAERPGRQLFAGGLIWRPGALELLRAVRAAGLPTALVTSTGRRLVEVALETLGRENFDVVVCGDEVAGPKPDPAPYRTAADAARRADRGLRRHRGLADRGGQRAGLRRGGAGRAGRAGAAATDGVHLRDTLGASTPPTWLPS